MFEIDVINFHKLKKYEIISEIIKFFVIGMKIGIDLQERGTGDHRQWS